MITKILKFKDSNKLILSNIIPNLYYFTPTPNSFKLWEEAFFYSQSWGEMDKILRSFMKL